MPRLHDDTRHDYLGRSGVHDVDTVVDAVVAHEACGPFIAGELARAVLGPDVDEGLTRRLGRDFVDAGLQLRPLVRAVLEAGLQGAATSLVQAPVPWLASMIRATAAPVTAALAALARGLQAAGQVPMDAPSVAGWPGGRAWLSSAATVARVDLAAALAGLTPTTSPAWSAASRGDVGALADALGRPGGFGEATAAALRDAAGGGRGAATTVLTVAMAAPDSVLV
ncbi:MAG: DUF1800 family protein [Acidimicrobiales bacterium]